MICPDCGLEPKDPEAHREFHDRIRMLMAKKRMPIARPVSSEERKEMEDDA